MPDTAAPAAAVTAAPAPLVKCLVWDLDNTLWQGTVMEGDEPVLLPGVRETLAELDRRGVLHAVASRNDHDLAWTWLERLGVAEYFVAARIGWGPKSESVASIAEHLRFATGTLAFVDDQPHERAEVAARLPEVRCHPATDVPDLPGRAEYSPRAVTADAAQRRRMYQAGQAREAAREEHTGPDEEFLRSLRIEMRISRATATDIERLAELTLRTSQMNATGVHYSGADLLELIDDPQHAVLAVSMRDRFGSHGAVGIVLLRTGAPVWHLKLLATSCRVVPFGAGTVLLRWLTDRAARTGVDLVADFRPTDRNRMMEIAYRFAGFADAPGAATAGLPAPAEGMRRLFLRPSAQSPVPTVRVLGTDPGAPDDTQEHPWES